MNILSTRVLPSFARVHFNDADFALLAKLPHKSNSDRTRLIQTLHIFDVFLDITGLGRKDFQSDAIMSKFRGFLYSQTNAKHSNIRLLMDSTKIIFSVFSIMGFESKLSYKRDGIEKCITAYQASNISQERVKYYCGWWVKTHDGENIFLNLSRYYTAYGREYCEMLFTRALLYFHKFIHSTGLSKSRHVQAVLDLLTDCFQSDKQLELLWEPMELNYFIEYAYDYLYWQSIVAGHDQESFHRGWAAILNVVEEFFIVDGFLPEAQYELSRGNYKAVVGADVFGMQARKNLVSMITPIPLEISNDQAAKQLYVQINEDMNGVLIAAEDARNEILSVYRRRVEASKNDFCLDALSEEEIAYIARCKSWEEINYEIEDRYEFSKIFGERKNLATELGLLDSTTLLPFIYLLINEVPAITKSWLMKFQVADKFDQEYGFDPEQFTAVSEKPRKGPKLAQQNVTLTAKACELLSEIYELTGQARHYLKKIKSAGWKYLLLSSSTGTSAPTRLGKISGMSAQTNCDSIFAKHIHQVFDTKALAIKKRLSLKSMRVTAAVIVYFKTSSVQAMSEALGHETYNPILLDRYLPLEIRQYYLDRWIRLFQCGLIFEAFKGTPYLLETTGLDSFEQLEGFLSHHQLKPLPAQLNLKNFTATNDFLEEGTWKAIVPADPVLCTVLLTISKLAADCDLSGQKLHPRITPWRRTADFISHAVNLLKEDVIDIVSTEVAEIFSRSKYSDTVAEKLRSFILA